MIDLILSPHLDDATFSCGEQIQRCADPTVVTIFGGASDHARDEMRIRWDEELAAATILGYRTIVLHFPEAKYRDGDPDVGLIAEALRTLIEMAGVVYIPLGITHPDHLIVSDLGWDLCWAAGKPPILYEELPYRVEQPIETWDRIDALQLRQRGECDVPPRMDIDLKLLAIEQYESQNGGRDLHTCLVDERFWRPRMGSV